MVTRAIRAGLVVILGLGSIGLLGAGGAAGMASAAPDAHPSAAKPTIYKPTIYTYPPSPRGTVTDTYFGTTIADPYRWLEDSRDPSTLAWIDAQANLTRRYLGTLPSLPTRTTQVDELLDTPTWQSPRVRQGRTFWLEQPVTAEQPVLMWMDASGTSRVLVDPTTIPGSGPVSIAEWTPSPDGRFVVWAASQSGSDWRTLRVIRVADGTPLPEVIPDVRFTTLTWTLDSTAFAYQAYPRPSNDETAATGAQMRYHVLGTPVASDAVLVQNPSDPTERYWMCCDDSESKVLIGIGLGKWTFSWMAALRPGEPIIELFTTSARLYPEIIRVSGRSVWLREREYAPRGRVVRVDVDDPDPEAWTTVVPEQADTLTSATAAGDRIVATYLHNAASRMRIFNTDGTPGPAVRLPELGTAEPVVASPNQSTAYFNFSSFTRPSSVLSLDTRSGKVRTWRAPELPFDPADFTTTSAVLPSKDGAPVHAFIVRRRDVVRDGKNPTLLYGYGGFNIALTPEYRPEWIAWMQSGGVLVYANIRGGGEYGSDWFLAGTRLTKQRSFDDFIAVAEWLKMRRWTDTRHLAITGRSNGGLLVGAVMTQRPDLAAVAIPQVGVLDMLRYHTFTIGAFWASNYGRSDDSPEMLQALLAYSPVHNVRPGVRYPATLITTAESDDRVVPAHSYKFAAALQADNAGKGPILIRIERGAGHGSGASRDQQIAQIADRLAFIDANIGTAPVVPTPVFRR